MTALFVFAAFGAATWVSQRWIGPSKVQTQIAVLAAIHAAMLVAALAALALWERSALAGALLFWTGAGLCWFVVRSHLESSILLALVIDLDRGAVARELLLERCRAAHSLDERLRELHAAGLIHPEGGRLTVTGRGRAVLALFRWLARDLEPRR